MNVQKNLRQFVTDGGGASPWSLAGQPAFDLFKASAKPETSVTYELGIRASHPLALGLVTQLDGQINVYHVDFIYRLLQISTTPVILAIIGGNPVLANVGSVRTDGIDLAGALHFNSNFLFIMPCRTTVRSTPTTTTMALPSCQPPEKSCLRRQSG